MTYEETERGGGEEMEKGKGESHCLFMINAIAASKLIEGCWPAIVACNVSANCIQYIYIYICKYRQRLVTPNYFDCLQMMFKFRFEVLLSVEHYKMQ